MPRKAVMRRRVLIMYGMPNSGVVSGVITIQFLKDVKEAEKIENLFLPRSSSSVFRWCRACPSSTFAGALTKRQAFARPLRGNLWVPSSSSRSDAKSPTSSTFEVAEACLSIVVQYHSAFHGSIRRRWILKRLRPSRAWVTTWTIELYEAP